MDMVDNEGVLCTPAPHCACCGGTGQAIHTGLRDQLFGAPGTWSTRRCTRRGCGLAWLDPQPLPSEIGKLYRTYYTHGSDAEHAALEAGEQPDAIEMWRYVSSGKVALLKHALGHALPWRRFAFDSDYVYLGSRQRPGRLLDVGCGAGEYLRVVAAAGWDPVGIDFDEQAVAMARRRGIEAHVGDLVSAGFPAESFDAVTMGNVIEHLPDPAAVFAECRRILRPGGKLVMMTPNIDAYCHDAYGPDWRGLEVPRHLYLYSAATLRRFAKAAGFGHVEAFSPLRNEGAVTFMADESERIAAAAGRRHARPDASRLGRKAALGAWLGRYRGEWVHLAAER